MEILILFSLICLFSLYVGFKEGYCGWIGYGKKKKIIYSIVFILFIAPFFIFWIGIFLGKRSRGLIYKIKDSIKYLDERKERKIWNDRKDRQDKLLKELESEMALQREFESKIRSIGLGEILDEKQPITIDEKSEQNKELEKAIMEKLKKF